MSNARSMQVRDDGGSIVSFRTWCGGLPAPEAANNPMGYKFSWYPKGVVEASLNPAQYMVDEKVSVVINIVINN